MHNSEKVPGYFGIKLESADDATLRAISTTSMHAQAGFAALLPSGAVVRGDEAMAFCELFAPETPRTSFPLDPNCVRRTSI